GGQRDGRRGPSSGADHTGAGERCHPLWSIVRGMGHEIVYCYWCSNRILGADFEKGAAIIIGNHACCPECRPKVLASLPASQRETLLAELSKSTGPRPLPRGTPKGGTPMSA